MSLNRQEWSDGVLRKFWDADSDPRTYYEYDAQGVQTLARPFNAAENTIATNDAAVDVAEAAAAARVSAVRLIITDLVAEKARVQLVIDKANASITANDTKDVARAAKRIADAAIDIAKLLTS